MDYWNLGEVATLDAIENEFGSLDRTTGNQQVKDTAEAVELLEKTGIAFPFDPVLEQNIRIFLQVGFSVAAKRFGTHWLLDGEDSQKLSMATAQLIQHYMPEFERMGPLGNFAIVAGSVVGPRALLTIMQNKTTSTPTVSEPEQQQKDINDAA